MITIWLIHRLDHNSALFIYTLVAPSFNEAVSWFLCFLCVHVNTVFSNILITSLSKDKEFITVKHRTQQVLETVAGKRSYRLSMKVKAFPRPEVAWYDHNYFPISL